MSAVPYDIDWYYSFWIETVLRPPLLDPSDCWTVPLLQMRASIQWLDLDIEMDNWIFLEPMSVCHDPLAIITCAGIWQLFTLIFMFSFFVRSFLLLAILIEKIWIDINTLVSSSTMRWRMIARAMVWRRWIRPVLIGLLLRVLIAVNWCKCRTANVKHTFMNDIKIQVDS